MRGATIEKTCANCKTPMTVRLADHKRGWGKFCSKSCKAKKQTAVTGIAGPHYKAEGRTVQQMASGSFAKSKLKHGRHPRRDPAEGKFCSTCGCPAVVGFQTNFDNDGQNERTPSGGYIEWQCEQHYDDTHPFADPDFNNQ